MPSNTHSGHRMQSRVGTNFDPDHVASIVGKMRIIGISLGIAVLVVSVVIPSLNGGFEWTSYNTSRSGSGTGLSYEGMGVILGAVFILSPISLGFAFRAASGKVLYLDGTRLTVVGPGRGEPTALDLTRTPAQVRLHRVPGTKPGGAQGREKTGSVRPELVLSPPDGPETVVELANLTSRIMRNSQETRLLAEAMGSAVDPAIQHAAGQLRTVARWQKLPVIHEAAPEAIPASPPDSSLPLPRTRVTVGVDAPEIEIVAPGLA